jgi:hypothetical protein
VKEETQRGGREKSKRSKDNFEREREKQKDSARE